MKRWVRIFAAAACILAACVSPAFAEGEAGTPPESAGGTAMPVPEMTIRGVLMHMDLEGGFYAVDGWMLQGEPSRFEPLLGKVVVVTGTPFEGVSIHMVRSLVVTNIAVDPDQSVSSGPDAKSALLPVLDARDLVPVEPSRPSPAAIAVEGKELAFDQGPLVSEGTLMVPLRMVVESAGGTVEWDEGPRRVSVRMPNRVALIEIGNDSAEVLVEGYAAKVRMARAPILAGGRTLVSADAVSYVLGLVERERLSADGGQGALMDLVLPAPLPVEDLKTTLIGTIKEVEAGEAGTRILVEGPAMASGEPSLTWVTIAADTKIAIEEDGETVDAGASALASGQVVEVEVRGAIAMSYPALAGAASVLIKK